MTYDFASEDRIETPNTYFYAPYSGFEFLERWQTFRSEVAARLGEAALVPGLTPADESDEPKHHGATAQLLEIALRQAHKASSNVSLPRPLCDVLHKFETTKRLHSKYDANFRALDRTRNRDLELYLGFAEVMEAGFEASCDLRFLNALLKVIDTLCSVSGDLDTIGKGRLKRLLMQERNIVAEYFNGKGLETYGVLSEL
jgi:methionyl-tRNA formyltransferase